MKKRISALLFAIALLGTTLLAICSCSAPPTGSTPCVTCKDDNGDHKCDGCTKVLTQCADDNEDHNCDICKKALTQCADENEDHSCDTCEKALSECKDENEDLECDICKKAIAECADGNGDHLCDACGKTLSSCADENNDHKCDACQKRMGCYNENGDHKCDKCNATITACEDKNGDHKCDICKLWHSDCYDPERDGACNICGESFTHKSSQVTPVVGGPDGSTLDPDMEISYLGCSLSDEGEFGTTLYLIYGQPYYTFYLAFTQQPIDVVIYHFGTSEGYHGDYIASEGYVRGGKYVVPVTYVSKAGQLPECISPRFYYTHEKGGQVMATMPGLSIELVADNDRPILLGVSPDGNVENAQDHFMIATGEAKRYLYFHFSAPINVSTVSGASFSVEDGYMENGIFTVRARMYSASVGTHKISVTVFVGVKESLYPLHTSSYNNVAILDVYKKSVVCTCTDKNGDHFCDLCQRVSECTDSVQDTDHSCDICGKLLGGHIDCDERGIHDGICDICGAAYAPTVPGGGNGGGVAHACEDKNQDHVCDDATCQKAVGTHEAAGGSHICDYCSQAVSECTDKDPADGYCDICLQPIVLEELPETLPEILEVYSLETGEAVENNLMHVGANGKAYFKITFSAPADGSYILYNGESFYAEPEFSYYESYTYLYYAVLPPQMSQDAYDTVAFCTMELCLAEQETPLATFECEQEKVRFLGVYNSPADYVEGTENTHVTVAANAPAVIYVACNADFYPTDVALQEDPLAISGDWQWSENVCFFEIYIPETFLQTEGEQIIKKLYFEIAEGCFDIYVVQTPEIPPIE